MQVAGTQMLHFVLKALPEIGQFPRKNLNSAAQLLWSAAVVKV